MIADGPALAAILFTDVVGSTALRSTLGEEAADELRRQHDAMLAKVVAGNGVRRAGPSRTPRMIPVVELRRLDAPS